MSRLVLVFCFLLCDIHEPKSFQDALIGGFVLAEQGKDLKSNFVSRGRDAVPTLIPEEKCEVKHIFLHIHLPPDPSWGWDVSTSCCYVAIVFLLDIRTPAGQPAKRIFSGGQVCPGSWREEQEGTVAFLCWDFNFCGGDAVPAGSVRFKRGDARDPDNGHVWQGIDRCQLQFNIDLLAFLH